MVARNPVLAALAQARLRAAPMFARWCELNGVPFCPARPADVVRFVSVCAPLGIERLWSAIREVSCLHDSLGLADPTLGASVTAAVSDVADIDPPRSWSDQHKLRFRLLPYDVQLIVVSNDARRERALRRAQNEAAVAKHKLAAKEFGQPNSAEEIKSDEVSQSPDS